jgi:hypothetical protein
MFIENSAAPACSFFLSAQRLDSQVRATSGMSDKLNNTILNFFYKNTGSVLCLCAKIIKSVD